ncbi:MAG: 4Fe-4S binding protein [Oscillospiraceae bacterium]
MENKYPILFKEKKDCCGCSACYTVCTQKAISMQVDDEGFSYPIINEDKCIFCKKCIAVCPLK